MEHSTIILSILICHLLKRDKELSRLTCQLEKQCKDKNNIEILIEEDNGELCVGAKRNRLLRKSKGEYVTFIDDDDEVSDDYIESIMIALESKPDCVGIEGIMRGDGYSPQLFRHSIQFQGHYTGTDAFYRTPNHLNPMKSVIAKRVFFQEIDFGEDKKFSYNVRSMLKKEVYIFHPIYFYNKSLVELISEKERHGAKE
jgi:glycosyltransferase involved in cell wall biosynthesis